MASTELDRFLARHKLVSRDVAKWRAGVEMEFFGYLCSETPPVGLVSSVRAVVFKGDLVLVMRNLDGTHILPGGRVEDGESLEETLHRELLEEAGVEIEVMGQIGVVHFRHTTPKPKDYPYPYPDFLWPVHVASFVNDRPDAKVEDDYEISSRFLPLGEVREMKLGEHERVFLEAAVEVVSQTG